MINFLRNETLVVIVTYNPNIPMLERCLNAIEKQFDNIIVVDNASTNINLISEYIKKNHLQVELLKLNKNMGIAYAQNLGLNSVKTNRSKKWLLTLDQDSVIPENLTEEYEKTLSGCKNVGLIGCAYTKKSYTVIDTPRIISSGSLINIKKLLSIGGFNNGLFISHVDHDCSLRMLKKGYRTILNSNVLLEHNLGSKTNRRTFLGNYYTYYKPIRYYYNTRSAVYIFKKHFFTSPYFTLEILLYSIFVANIFLLIYEPNKLKNLRMLVKAFWDGATNQMEEL